MNVTIYGYDGWGTLIRERVQQSSVITTTDFVLDEQRELPRVIGEIRSDGSEVLYAYGPDGVAAQRTIIGGTPQPLVYPLLDGLGSVRHLTDASGTLIRSIFYDAWGTVRHSTGTAWTRLGYTGEPMGVVDGTVYLRARMYNPALGRFLQRDTFPGIPERPQSLNRFVYTEGNPVNWTDPSGHIVPILIGIWLVAEVALQVYDTYETANTVLDPCIALWEKGLTLGLYIGGALLPGGGYAAGGKQVVKHLDEAAEVGESVFRVVDNAVGEGVEHSTNKADEAGDLIEAFVTQCARNSFSAETLVSTAEGLRPISQIAVGDLVLGWDETTSATGYYTVTAVMLHTDAAQIHLSIGGEQIETTPEHPFYTGERGWVEAGDLWNGAHIRQANGDYATVIVLWVDDAPQVMYNLTVAEAHTFFVGGGRALVHNTSGCSPWLMHPTARGKFIEDALASSDYSSANGWFRAGALNNGWFPLVDFQKGNILVSLKTVDTGGSSWLSTMQKHIDDLASRGAMVDGNLADMVLDLRVQPGGASAAQSLITYGRSAGVEVIIKEFS